jgi:hypothetical protein
MYSVSNEYHDIVNADKVRIYGKVQIDYTDPFLDQSINVAAIEEANISFPAQTADNVQEPVGKIASLDGSWVLDGTYSLAPADGIGQMGWWGSQLAGSGGAFTAPYPTLTVTFLPRPITKLKVVGDSARGEYPMDFTVKLYGTADALLYTETVASNLLISWNKTLNNAITQVVKMVLEITKWSHQGRQCKIVEFFTSIQEVYEDDVLMINLLEEREVSQGSLPVGNISSNEIDIRLVNNNRKFDAGNTQSPLYQTLKQNRRIKAWLGVDTSTGKEYVPLGVFWSGDWNVPEQDVYAQTTGRDRLEMLRKSTYSTSQVQINQTLYSLAIGVLDDAGLTEEEYFVDTELQDYLVPYSYFEDQSHREALRKIAEACLGQVYCDRNGVIRIEGPSYLQTQTVPVDILTGDDYFSKDNPVKWSEVANYIEVETQPLRPDVLQEVYKSNEVVSIAAVETKTVTAYYNNAPCINAAVSISGTGSITSATYYAWGATVKVYSAAAGTFELTINAQPLKILNKDKVVRHDADSIVDMGTLKYTYPGNPLVQTVTVAETIADRLLAYYKNPRRDVEVDWRGNPAMLLGDRITVTDKLEQNDYFVIKQELEFNGALNAKLSGRKV